MPNISPEAQSAVDEFIQFVADNPDATPDQILETYGDISSEC